MPVGRMAAAGRQKLKVYSVWLVLTLPLVYIVLKGITSPPHYPYLRQTGLVSCWLLIATLAVTPLGMLFGPQPWVRWLRANRRYLGVASFGYALMHLAVFTAKASPRHFLESFIRFDILLGWLGFAVMLAMVLTSNDYSVRRLSRSWKRLQQWVYPGAVLVLAHWALTEKHYLEVAIYTVPLIVLMMWRMARRRGVV